jgi:hypothetical protein
VRKGGGPRVHPVCPIIFDQGIYAFIISSPKLSDLRRDGRYALHSYPLPHNEDVFYITGSAASGAEPALRASIEQAYRAERDNAPMPELAEQTLFEFRLEAALLTRTTGHGDANPRHEIWKAGAWA